MAYYKKTSSYYSKHRSSSNVVSCFKCGGPHYASACDTSCYRCGGPHYVTNCPQRSGGGGGGRKSSGATSSRPAKKAKKSAWEGMKVKQLKAACKERGLAVTGVKAVLVKRLQDYVVGASSSAAVAPPAAAATAAQPSNNDDISAFFDTDNDAVMADSKPAAKPTASFSQTSTTSYMSFSQTSQASEMTDEQRERIKRKREEARQKRLSAGSQQSGMENNFMSQSPQGKMDNPYKRAAGYNPYDKKSSSPIKRDESKPDGLYNGGRGESSGGLTLSSLPPLPPDTPSVRDETSNKLSDQQLEVIMAARPPQPAAEDGTTSITETNARDDLFPSERKASTHHPMVRVNAAAGTGKTTVLIHLAIRLIDLGHKGVNYLTFSKASANDAKSRMQAALDDEHKSYVSASTLHSCAMRLLDNEPLDEEFGEEEKDKAVLDELAFQGLIKRQWGEAIEEHVRPAVEHLRTSKREDDAIARSNLDGREKMLFERALYYLFKTFTNFTINSMSLDDLRDRKNIFRHYYPVSKAKGSDFHEGGLAAKLGFPPSIYTFESTYSFYADVSVEIWDYVVKHGIRTYDIEVKKAQLKQLRIPCSVLLVDECQDLDGCQVAWLEGQKQFGTHIFFVGDSAQCIYGFRGAKSKHIMKLICIDIKLTKSWRFGPEIAKAANIPLFAKEKSIQTTENHGNNRLWIPYRVQGASKEMEAGKITTISLLQEWKKYKPLTLIGTTNSGLMIKAMDLLGLAGLKNPESEEDDNDENSSGVGVCDLEAEDAGLTTLIDVNNLPRFHINGKGETSGTKKWSKATRQVRILYELYSSKDETGYLPMELSARDFPQFANEGPITWSSFIELCQVKEISTFDMAIHVVATYEHNTLKAMDAFESNVIAKKCSEEEADIILTTCHSAKGLEWDHVEIADDILDISTSFTDSQPAILRHPSFLKSPETSKGEKRKGYQFVLDRWRDQHINMLYVAMTRARKTLSVPRSTKMLLQDFDRLHFLVGHFKKDAFGEDARKMPSSDDESMIMMGKGKKSKKLTKGEVWNLYHDVCVPLRTEMGIPDDCMIMPTLFPDCEDSMDIEFEEEKEEEVCDVKAKADTAVMPDKKDDVADFFDC